MLHHLDDSLEAYFRALVPLPDRDVDVSFDTPDRKWGSGVTRPTVNLFLWDVRRSKRRATSGIDDVEAAGRRVRRLPPPRIEFRYLVTAWAAESRDQHQLLGAVLQAIVQNREMPADALKGPLAELDPRPVVELAEAGVGAQSELWSALDGQLKAGIDLLVTAPVEPESGQPVGPPVESVEVATMDRTGSRFGRRRRHITEGLGSKAKTDGS